METSALLLLLGTAAVGFGSSSLEVVAVLRRTDPVPGAEGDNAASSITASCWNSAPPSAMASSLFPVAPSLFSPVRLVLLFMFRLLRSTGFFEALLVLPPPPLRCRGVICMHFLSSKVQISPRPRSPPSYMMWVMLCCMVDWS